ncbi:MAG: S1 RNA-binding domain-containing protein [Dehalococcoidia bacterium]|nr:S1 RNA-binding domain-containing protein [Dehalococcoidia bacterium]
MTNSITNPDAPAAEMQPEIEDMAALLEEADIAEPRQLRRGEVVEGTVMSIERDGALIDIGFKSEGVVPQQEMHSLGADPLTKISVGERVLVFVVQPETPEGQVALSIDRARGEQGWRVLQTRFETGEIFEAEITGFNKGGLLANVEGVNAFIPMSQVVGAKPGTDGANPLSAQVGRVLRLKVIEINRRRNRVILSERAALQEWRAEQKDRLLDELNEGDIRTGTITSIRNFGVFVDMGGADGLVHLSELSWDRNAQPEDLFKVGDEVKVYVMRVDRESKKIALSIRRASPEEWEQLITQYAVGDVVPGVITKLVAFGAFARLPGPVEGLVHVSELVERRIGHPEEVVEEGDVVPLKIVRIEHDRHRLGLSLREARREAEMRGWQFDQDGRVIQVPDEAKEKFGDEIAATEQRYQTRATQAESRAAEQVQQAVAPSSSESSGPSQPRDDGPVLTAMQAAMQQAQAELREKQETTEPEAAEASDAPQASAAEAATAAAPAPEAPGAAEAPADEAPAAQAEPEAPPAAQAEADAPAAEAEAEPAAEETPAEETPPEESAAEDAPAEDEKPA